MTNIMREIHEKRDRQRTPLADWEVSLLDLCRRFGKRLEPYPHVSEADMECEEGECKL